MIKIETERLILRPFTIDDINAAHELNLDPEISKYTGDGGVVSREETERRIREDVLGDYQKYGFGRLAIELKGQDHFIGFAGLKYLEDIKEVDLGYRLKSKYWGQGIATEAAKACVDYGFNRLKLEKIIAFIIPENIGSFRVLEKLNFSFDKVELEEDILVHQYSLENY